MPQSARAGKKRKHKHAAADNSAEITEASAIRAVQESINKGHMFGIKIWKPALYAKQRSIDAHSYEDLHQKPDSMPSSLHLSNFLYVLLIGWWLSAIYVLYALALVPLWGIGSLLLMALQIKNRSTFGRSPGIIYRSLQDLSGLDDYFKLLFNLSWYVLWPFGNFIAKRLTYKIQFPSADSSESEPFLNDEEVPFSLPPSELSPPILEAGIHGLQVDENEDNLSILNPQNKLNVYFVFRLISRTWKRGFSSTLFFLITLVLLVPVHLLVTILCYFFVFPIPVGKLLLYLLRHLLQHPLLLSAHGAQTIEVQSDITDQAAPQRIKQIFYWRTETAEILTAPSGQSIPSDSIIPTIIATPRMQPFEITTERLPNEKEYQIVLCAYRAMGAEYLRYTIDGVNIIFVNLLALVAITLAVFHIIAPKTGFVGIASKPVLFFASLLSTIPLAFFIGMAVSSITTQTGSVAIGSVVNATFGSIIEIILYTFALMEGKEELVTGAIIGSFLCGLLALPGAAMFSGGLSRSEQIFNAKSTSVTSTMLYVSIIGVFTPTVFQYFHGTQHIDCQDCQSSLSGSVGLLRLNSCKSCRIYQPHPTKDPIYQIKTRPLMYICATVLVMTYAVGLLFTLRTHAHKIYGHSIANRPNTQQNSVSDRSSHSEQDVPEAGSSSKDFTVTTPQKIFGKAKRNAVTGNDSFESLPQNPSIEDKNAHHSPGWSIFKSCTVLIGCTLLYTLIAEILIACLDDILIGYPWMTEKTLGMTVLAVVPTVTEFYNAISFASTGNIVLALEIGSAYAIQVALLQIPALVAFSAIWINYGPPTVDPESFAGKGMLQVLYSWKGFIQNTANEMAGKSEFTLDDITTIFVVGFPEDMEEREFQNMFTFCPGFEAAALKIPLGGDNDDNLKKQIIGFAKFRSIDEAAHARDVLNGKKVDTERGCIIKAEMAKKNLHTKRGLPSGYDGFKQYYGINSAFRRSTSDSLSGESSFMTFQTHGLSFNSQYSDNLPLHPDEFDPFSPATDNESLGTERLFASDKYADDYDSRIPPLFGTSYQSRGFSSVLYNSDALLSKSLGSMNINEYANMSAFDSRRNSTFSYSTSVPPGADQNPPCNTLYVGNLPSENCEDELRLLFQGCLGYKRLSYKTRPNGSMCFVEFENVHYATQALFQLYGKYLSNSTKGGIRLSYSKNPLGVRGTTQSSTQMMPSDSAEYIYAPSVKIDSQ